MAGRVATATALGSRDCHLTEATAAPAQMHRSCSAPPLSNAGAEPQASIERGMIARARGENEHAVGAGRPQDWRLRLGSARQLERGDRGSVPASRTFAEIFECEASGRDARSLRGCFLWKLRTGLTAGPKNLMYSS